MCLGYCYYKTPDEWFNLLCQKKIRTHVLIDYPFLNYDMEYFFSIQGSHFNNYLTQTEKIKRWYMYSISKREFLDNINYSTWVASRSAIRDCEWHPFIKYHIKFTWSQKMWYMLTNLLYKII